MLPLEWCFGLFFATSVVVGAFQARRYGVPQGLGASMAIALASASWFEIPVVGIPLSVPTSVAIVMLSIVVVFSPKILLSPLGWIDLLVGGLFVWNCVVDVFKGSPLLSTAPLAYGEWILPYAAGRYAMIQPAALQRLAPWFCTVACILSVAAVFESLTSVNLWSVLLHHVDDSVNRPTDKRYDLLYRAISNVRNPIFLGVLLLTLTPWAISLKPTDSTDRRKVIGSLIVLCIIFAGIMATVSRGPVIAAILALALAMAFANRIFRYALVAVSILLLIFVVAKFDTAVSVIDTGVNERGAIMQLDNQAEVYDGTRHRILILRVYTPLILKGGATGYGTEATTGFPPKIPGLPRDERTRSRLGIVDNSYLLVGLRLGCLGLALFVGMLAAAATGIARMRYTSNVEMPSNFSIHSFCAGIAIMFAIAFVYWDYDFGFWVLFYCGVMGGIVSQQKRYS